MRFDFSPMTPKVAALRSLGIFGGIALLSSCEDQSSVVISEVRDLAGEEQAIRVVDSGTERYRLPRAEGMSTGGEGSQDAALPFVWVTPEGWTQQTGRPMRDLSFSFGEEGEGECYLSRLPGAGGGLEANVNRWRKQMGQPDLEEEEIVALPTKSLFGLEGTYVDVSGTFTGMGAGAPKEDYRMLGIILTSEAGAVFVKLTGPSELVAEQEANFEAFCASLQPRG